MVPYHWGTFNFVTSGANDGMVMLRKLLPSHARAEYVKIVEPGGTFEIPLPEHAPSA